MATKESNEELGEVEDLLHSKQMCTEQIHLVGTLLTFTPKRGTKGNRSAKRFRLITCYYSSLELTWVIEMR